jgi:signal transduction histidine kinase
LDTAHIARAAGYLKEAEKAALRAKNLTGKFLIFSQGGAPVKGPADFSDLMREVVSKYLNDSNVLCKYTIPEDLWWVEVDAARITQALGNIIVNAREAIPQGGIIKINAQNLKVDSTSKATVPFLEVGQYVKVSILDQGSGIPPENLQKIFDPYFSSKDKFSQKGMGLGLTIAYAIVKKHGGYIGVESEVGLGTAIHIYLPANQAPEKNIVRTKGTISYPDRKTGKNKFLVIYDEK